MNTSSIKNFDELPLFLNAQLVSRTLGVSPAVVELDETSLVSSIWGEGRDTLTLAQRGRKFSMKLALTAGNAWHRRRLPRF